MCVLCFGRHTGRLHQVVFFSFVKCCFSIGLIIWYVFNVHIFNMKKKFFLQKSISFVLYMLFLCGNATTRSASLRRMVWWRGRQGNEYVSLFSPPPLIELVVAWASLSLSLLLSFLRELRMIHRSGRGPLSATVSPTAMLLSLRYLFF